MTVRTTRPIAASAFAVIAVSWVVVLFLAPTLSRHTDRPAAAVLAVTVYTAGALVCHQASDRSFHIAGVRMPVCARCAGLYLGAAVGMVFWWGGRRSRPARRFLRSPVPALVVVAVPTALTWGAAMAGLWDPGNFTRALAALPLGLAVGALVTATIAGDLR